MALCHTRYALQQPISIRLRGQTKEGTLLTKPFDETLQFSLGLGVNYGLNFISKHATTGMVTPGRRAPDALVYRPGSHIPVRLHSLIKNIGQWHILLFAGELMSTKAELASAAQQLSNFTVTMPRDMIRFLTVIGQNVIEGDKLFSNPRLGYLCFGRDQSAHFAYGISPGRGAVVVLRPDRVLTHATTLGNGDSAIGFFSGLVGMDVALR